MSDDADDPQAGNPEDQFDALSDSEKIQHLESQAQEDESHGKTRDAGGHEADRQKIKDELLGPISGAVDQLRGLADLVQGMDGDQLHDHAEQKQIHSLSSAANQALQGFLAKAASAKQEAESANIYASAIDMAMSAARKAEQELSGANTNDAHSLYGSYKQAWSDASSAHTSIEGF